MFADSQLKSGIVTIRVTLSAAANGGRFSTDEELIIAVVDSYRFMGGRGTKTAARVALVKGETSTSVDLDYVTAESNRYYTNPDVIIEKDGNLSDDGARGDIAALPIPYFQWSGYGINRMPVHVDNLRFLFVNSTSTATTPTSVAYRLDRTRYRNDSLYQQPINATQPTTAVADTFPNVLHLMFLLDYDLSESTQVPITVQNMSQPTPQENMTILNQCEWLNAMNRDELPGAWQSYTGLHFIFLSYDDLYQLSMEPGRSRVSAIEHWLAAGGRLVLTDCGKASSPLRNIGSMIAPPGSTDRGPKRLSWQSLSPDEVESEIEQNPKLNDLPTKVDSLQKQFKPKANPKPNNPYYLSIVQGNEELPSVNLDEWTNVEVDASRIDDSSDVDLQSNVVVSDYALGRIIALDGNCSQYDPTYWRRLIAAAFCNSQGTTPAEAIGSANIGLRAIDGFWLPGVGQPPTNLFMGLISLFAIFVGPLCYTALRRVQRLTFILVIVPSVAGFATIGLIGYAVLVDGVVFQAQRLGYTRIDKSAGVAFTQTIQSVFSNVPVSSYSFDEQTMALVAHTSRTGSTVWFHQGSDYRLSSDETRTRTPHQVTTARVDRTNLGMEVRPTPDAGNFDVTNHLQSPIAIGLLRTTTGFYVFDALAPDETGTAESMNLNQVRSRLTKLNELIANQTTPVDQSDALFRSMDLEYGCVQSFFANIESFLKSMRPGEYLCLVNHFPLAQTLRPDTVYQADWHIVHGQW